MYLDTDLVLFFSLQPTRFNPIFFLKKIEFGYGAGLGMVFLYPIRTHTYTRFWHTRPIPIFPPFFVPEPTINKEGSFRIFRVWVELPSLNINH